MSHPGVTVKGAKVIIAGGGLAGLSAAHSVLERGGRVLVLDKKEFLGGNSTKATSGINGAYTRQQQRLGIQDSVDLFEQDTATSANSGVKAPATPLAQVLTHNSGSAVEWLVARFGLDLSLVSRLGGHSQPRTHRGKERFPGMTITYALMEKFDDIAKAEPSRAAVVTSARVTKLLTGKDGAVNGVEFEKDGKTFKEYGPVVISTGGFGADFSDDSLLKQFRPDLLHLPTTNGDHCTGDGIKISTAIGGSTIDMKSVQVHPTGLVHPAEPNNKVKFLAAEALRGVGGLLLDKNGKRFSNELGTRDYVTGLMWKNEGPFRLVLNSKGVQEIEWHIKHYIGRGLMKKFDNGAALAKDIGIPVAALKDTFDKYNAAAKAGTDQFGKKYFINPPFDINESFAVAIVTPVVLYCMGGVQINTDSAIVRENGTAIPGLFAAGEVAGGVHGKNRLGGSGLLGCVVYGRVAGDSASRALFDQLSVGGRAAGAAGGSGAPISAIISQGGVETRFDIQPQSNQVSIGVSWDGASPQISVNGPVTVSGGAASAPAAAAAAPAPAPVPAPVANKTYTLGEIAKHSSEKDAWVAVNGEVLNITSFLDKHPGGKQVLLLYLGKDASEEFNMMHKPDVVQKYAPETIIGKLAPTSKL